jgi:hypothetical protein
VQGRVFALNREAVGVEVAVAEGTLNNYSCSVTSLLVSNLTHSLYVEHLNSIWIVLGKGYHLVTLVRHC